MPAPTPRASTQKRLRRRKSCACRSASHFPLERSPFRSATRCGWAQCAVIAWHAIPSNNMRITCWLVALVLALGSLSDGSPTLAHPAAAGLPADISDREFWMLTERLSEPNGYFQSDNVLSNERGYQVVIPDLVGRTTPGGVYVGVGPEQTFPYIVAVKAHLALIVDIRRGN